MGSDVGSFIWAIRQQESGGNYSATNPSGAMGAYQILASNVPEWSKEALGYSVTPQQFLASKQLQDTVAGFKLTQYYNSYGAARGAADWYGGGYGVQVYGTPRGNDPQSGGPSVNAYAADVLALMNRAPAGGIGSSAGPSPTSSPSSPDPCANVPADLKAACESAYGSSGAGSSDPLTALLGLMGPLPQTLTEATKVFDEGFNVLTALFKPATYVRIGAGLFGTVIFLASAVMLVQLSMSQGS